MLTYYSFIGMVMTLHSCIFMGFNIFLLCLILRDMAFLGYITLMIFSFNGGHHAYWISNVLLVLQRTRKFFFFFNIPLEDVVFKWNFCWKEIVFFLVLYAYACVCTHSILLVGRIERLLSLHSGLHACLPHCKHVCTLLK